MTNSFSRDLMERMFDGIRSQTTWNIDGDMVWGYFFCDDEPARLTAAGRELAARGYRVVDMYETEEDGEPTGEFVLHVERVETHTVDSLVSRNTELARLAASWGLSSYDGMDVGPVKEASD